MKKISNLLNNLKMQERFNKIKGSITLTLSVFVLVMTLLVLMNPAFTLNGSNKLQLNDSFINDNYSWKVDNGYSTTFDLNLNFVDSDGATINGNNISVNTDGLVSDNAFTFGSTNKSEYINLLNDSGLEVILTDNGKYMFDYAEVLVDGSWQRLVLDEGFESKIWCVNCLSETEPEDKQYGWRGTYGIDATEYIINESTEYKLSYIFEANEVLVNNDEQIIMSNPILTFNNVNSLLTTARNAIPLNTNDTVTTLGSESGIKFNLYNYDGTNGQVGMNDNGLYGYFAFLDTFETTATPLVNKQTDAGDFVENRARVEPVLDGTKNPIFDCRGYCTNKSLGYLFGQPKNGDGLDTKGVTSYSPNNTILQKITKNGVTYYSYDSNLNAVDYDIVTDNFLVRNYIERGYLTTTFAGEHTRGEFLPFNYLVNASNPTKLYAGDATGRYNYESASNRDEIDHWFGMTMEFEFYMPEDGLLDNEHMIFSFTGDDDVWVFIDDVLVLDLGGTHGAVDGTIDFNTGVVKSNFNWEGVTTPAYQTSISEMFNIKAGVSFEQNENGTTFKDYSKHTLKFFYLERGAWVSNCKIEFNIPVLPSGSLSVKKDFEGVEKYPNEYEFMIYDVTNNAPVPMGTKYTVGETEKNIDNYNGTFKLRKDEVAIFLSKTDQDDPNNEYLRSNNQYYVKEVDSGIYADKHSCILNNVLCSSVDQTPNFMMAPSSKNAAVFKNITKTYSLNVLKEAINSYEGELFDFQLTFKDEFGNIVNANGLTITAPNGYTINPNNSGIINFQMETAQNILVAGIPYGTVIDIKELNHDGYHTSIKSIEGTTEVPLVQGDSYTINMIIENKDIKVYNTPGVELPETGGIGTLIYIVVGLSMVFASAVLSIAFIRSSKENN